MVLIDTAAHFAASKSPAYRDSTMTMFRALLSFLDEQHFTDRPLVPSFAQSPKEFRLELEALTSSGQTWVRSHFHTWMQNRDRHTTRHSFEDYMKSLRKTVAR